MKTLIFILTLISLSISSWGQKIDDISFGTDATLDIVTWNVENYPKNLKNSVDSTLKVMKALNFDILAMQEINSESAFHYLANNMDGYKSYLESSYFAGLGFLYDSTVIDINRIFEIYTTSDYWSTFPRSPMVMDFTYKNEQFIVINNHLKCCGDGKLVTSSSNDEENRRFKANNLLRNYVNSTFPNMP